jgi:AcrR family transcriptional regulator
LSTSQRLRPSAAGEVARAGNALDLPGADEDDRDRLIDAATRVASEIGYEETDVERISFWAGLSADQFFEHFDSREQCMLAAYDRFL